MKLIFRRVRDGWIDLEWKRMGNMVEVVKKNFIYFISWFLGRFDFSYVSF